MSDRRIFPRTVCVENQGVLEWSNDATAGATACRIVDISRGGALVRFDAEGDPAGLLRLRLETPAATGWSHARAMRHPERGLIALAFDGECPSDLYVGACMGIALNRNVN